MALALPWMVLQKTDDILVTGTVGAIALTAVLVGALLARLLVQKMGARSVIVLSFLLNLIGTAGIIFCFAQDILPIPLLIIFVIVDRLWIPSATLPWNLECLSLRALTKNR